MAKTKLIFNPISGTFDYIVDASQELYSNIINYRVNVFSELATSVPNPTEGELAFVKTATGVTLINRKSSGLYVYTGGNWTNERNEIREYLQITNDELSVLETEVQTNDSDIINLQNGLSSEVSNRQVSDSDLSNRITTLESTSQQYINTQTDESTFNTNRTVYNLFESDSDWIVKKSVFDNDMNVTNTKATPSNNPTQTDATTAWGNRLTLIYS